MGSDGQRRFWRAVRRVVGPAFEVCWLEEEALALLGHASDELEDTRK